MRCGNSQIIISDNNIVLSEYLDNEQPTVLLFDENTYECCSKLFYESNPELKESFKYIIKAGEEYKTIETCLKIWNEFINENILKNALFICIGGGVVSDLGGFVASIYKRGIDYIFIPTTLLSQVDASIGGKNGIDFKSAKNQLGIISFPNIIYVNPLFLNTLPKKEIISGYAEIVKYALIWDHDFWNMIISIEDIDTVNWLPIINRSIKIKSEIVNKDPYENNIRKSLNYGHTIGHAIESLFLKKGTPITHGEAIAVGMECELYISSHYFNWDINKLKNVVNYLRKTFSDIKIDNSDIDDLFQFMLNDKKNRGDGINFTLIEDIGEVIIDKIVPKGIIRQSIELYMSLRSNDKLTNK